MDKRIMGPSQDEYCRGCILVPGCNVILKDGESCGDRVAGIRCALCGGVIVNSPSDMIFGCHYACVENLIQREIRAGR